MLAPVLAQWGAIIAWLVTTRILYQDINLANTGNNHISVCTNSKSYIIP
jgi:NADH:ubiquinone oxidoreductase subunit E